MRNKVWIGISIICCILAGCKSNIQQASIQGEIIGLGNDTIYLFGTDEYFDRLDTIFITDGKFSKTLSIDTLILTTLVVNDSVEYPVFLNKGQTVSLHANLEAPFTSLRIKGNPLNEEYSRFQNNLYASDTLSLEYILEKTEEFIRSNPSSPISAYLLEKYYLRTRHPDYELIKELINIMAGDLKDLSFIQQANDLAEQQGKTITGKTAPAFNLKNLEGKGILRTSFKEKYLVLYFWASWCDSYSQDLPQLKELYNTYKKHDKFALLGVSLDLNRADWQEAIEKDTLEWEQVCDFSGWNGSVVKQYGILSLPSYTLVGPDGRIVDQKMTLDSLSNKLNEVLEAKK